MNCDTRIRDTLPSPSSSRMCDAQGRLDDGNTVELSLEVSAVDSDERAAAWGLALLKTPAASLTHAAPATSATTTATSATGHGTSLGPLPAPTADVSRMLIGKLHVVVHGAELDAVEYPKPVDCFFLLK